LVSKAFIPGKVFPSRSSKKAPPAVDKYVNPLEHLNLFIAATVSPPPAIETRDLVLVFSDIFFEIFLLPTENSSISK